MDQSQNSHPTAQARHQRPVPQAVPHEIGNRWAVIVGISTYQDERLKLKFAHRDAEELAQLIQTASAGGFEAERVKLLRNHEATTREVTHALRRFLAQPVEDDLVLIFFACHGAPDPYRPDVLYLLTYDTDYDDIATTALPMDEIDRTLRSYIRAKHVVVIADTCHSAAIGSVPGGRDGLNSAEITNRYLEEMSKTKPGVALLTSARRNELAFEGEQWGGGHGVFTHFLLQGMRGHAEGYKRAKDGIVRIDELFDFVRDHVSAATNTNQNPHFALGSDNRLPMAITGGLDAQEHYQLGCQLYELGWLIDDAGRFQSAARQFEEAIRLAKAAGPEFPQAELELGKSLVASKQYGRAIRVLDALSNREAEKCPPEAKLYLGIAHSRLGAHDAAIHALQKFVATAHPQDDNVAWVGEYIRFAQQGRTGNNYALLIGIDEYASSRLPRLRGPGNDVMAIRRLLTEKYSFAESDIITLTDRNATRQAIIDTLQEFEAKSQPQDTLIIHYSGLGPTSNEQGKGYVLFPHDLVNEQDQMENGIDFQTLHELLENIAARQKVLIIDTNANTRFVELARHQKGYTVVFAAAPGQEANEIPRSTNSDYIIGLLTYVLCQQLAERTSSLSKASALERAINRQFAELGYERQTALIVGNPHPFLLTHHQSPVDTFEFAQRRHYATFTAQDLIDTYTHFIDQSPFPFPQAQYSFGRAFMEKGNDELAVRALRTALEQRAGDFPEALLALGIAHTSAGRLTEAFSDLRTLLNQLENKAHLTSGERRLLNHTQSLTTAPEQIRRHALLVAVDHYQNPAAMPLTNAVSDARAIKALLVAKFAFQPEDITVLVDQAATNKAIRQAFTELVAKSLHEPALFYFAGYSAGDKTGSPTLAGVDGLNSNMVDIPLSELVKLAPHDKANLVTILDVAWSELVALQSAGTRDLAVPVDEARQQPVGAVSLYSWLLGAYRRAGALIIRSGISRKVHELKGSDKRGLLTKLLVHSLQALSPVEWTYAQWVAACESDYGFAPALLAADLEQPLLSIRPLQGKLLALFAEYEQSPATQVITLLPRLLEKRYDLYPEGHLNLGVAYAVKREFDKSIASLEKAIDQSAGYQRAEAHYHLGRVLFESQRQLGRAVTELELAIEQEPENAQAYFYRGQAILALVERETLVEAEKMLRTYLKMGAPLGEEERVLQFLAERKPESQRKAALQEGLRLAESGEVEQSIAAFEKAIQLGEPEAQFHLGKLLFDKGDFLGALGAMGHAIATNPSNGAALYYFGQALRQLIDGQLAEEALKNYLDQGAPLGHEEEIRHFLRSKNYQASPTR